MPQFVIEREIRGAGSMTEAQIRDVSLASLQTLKDMGPQIQWLHSYVTEDKVYCVYLAPDEDTIREHARKAGIPADRVAAVRRLIDPGTLNKPPPLPERIRYLLPIPWQNLLPRHFCPSTHRGRSTRAVAFGRVSIAPPEAKER